MNARERRNMRARQGFWEQSPLPGFALTHIDYMFAQNGYCPYCFKNLAHSHGYHGNIEHVMPIGLGGTDDWANRLYVCRRCNTRKGGRSPTACELLALEWVHPRLMDRIFYRFFKSKGVYNPPTFS